MSTTYPAGLDITAGGLTITAGGVTVTAGGLTVTAGGLTVAGAWVVNEAGGDYDTRIETDNISNGFVVDAGLDVFAFGAAGADDTFVLIKPPAATHTTTVNTYNLYVTPGGAQTIPSGTTSLVATARFDEPNITATGTVTAAATVYIADAPTEGSANYALYVGTGAVYFTTQPTCGGVKMPLKHKVSVPFAMANANVVTSIGILPVRDAVTITGASIAFVAIPASTLGTVVLTLNNRDASGGPATDNLLSTASVSMETGSLTNLTPLDFTLTVTGADLTLADGDYVYAQITADNADATGGTGGVITVEYTDV